MKVGFYLTNLLLATFAGVAVSDVVLLTAPANGTVARAGELLSVGFRVRLQGMSMLESVRLVLQDISTGQFISEILSSTRNQAIPQADAGPWQQQTTWMLPQDLPAGPFTVRAVGNASFPDGHGGRSRLEVEDRATIIIANPAAQPSIVNSASLTPETTNVAESNRHTETTNNKEEETVDADAEAEAEEDGETEKEWNELLTDAYGDAFHKASSNVIASIKNELFNSNSVKTKDSLP
ncbi:hypothetical protein BDF19DRAFT_415523 [Syncephalis fuscata]|nr:hypothetical protein BDF19DRAFT_415523 [Syncephalis fuscata]